VVYFAFIALNQKDGIHQIVALRDISSSKCEDKAETF
jgi:hypothetical protein